MRDLFYSSGGCKQCSNEDASSYMLFKRAHLPEEEKCESSKPQPKQISFSGDLLQSFNLRASTLQVEIEIRTVII